MTLKLEAATVALIDAIQENTDSQIMVIDEKMATIKKEESETHTARQEIIDCYVHHMLPA